MDVLGISLGHDTSFALVSEGKIVEIMEAERYFRQKRYKLSALTLEPGRRVNGYQHTDIAELELFIGMVAEKWGKRFDALAVQNQGRSDEHENLLSLLSRSGFEFSATQNVNHHLSHAALAYYTSPFSDAVVLSFDGTGNDGYTIVFQASAAEGVSYQRKSDTRFGQNYNNLGFIVGIQPDVSGTSSGKTMGLAAYGEIRQDWLPYAEKYIREYRKLPQKKNLNGLNSYGKGHRINAVGLNEIPDLRGYVRAEKSSLKDKVKRVVRGGEAALELRLPGIECRESQNLIKTVQAAWTQEVLALLKPFSRMSRNLCVIGGCALNGITNYAVQKSGLFENIHFVPNASDCGLSAGAALEVCHRIGKKRFEGYGGYYSPYLGQEAYDRNDLPQLRSQYPNREFVAGQVPEVLARLLAEDRIVGVIRGRYEVGPRALGNRSILCNPLNKNMRDILNQKVKHREWYRPFAPVGTAEDSIKIFTHAAEIPYMSVICYTRPEYREQLPSITHVDGSARLQTLRRDQNEFLYATLKEFEKESGLPVVLNTSFNPGGEPILNFCRVGLEMLKTTDLDLVLIENTLFAAPGREEQLPQKQ